MSSEEYTKAFYEGLRGGAEKSAEAVVPLVLDLVPVRSVVDVGCGQGAWLKVFGAFGVQEILGVDGDHIDRKDLRIPEECFRAADLSRRFSLNRSFDLAVSLEVAEHLPVESAPIFVESLIRLAPVILFSAAIPYQGGVRHVNEQWPDGWAELFGAHGYRPVDCVRRRIWRDESVDWWYAQNTFLFVRPDILDTNPVLRGEFERTNLDQLRLVHPRNYLQALQPVDVPDWRVGTAWRLLRLCVRNGIRRRLTALAGRRPALATLRNPPNFNSALERGSYEMIAKRSGRS